MLAALGFILDGVMLIGTMVAWGIETVLNAGIALLAVLWLAAVALLPSMPSVPTVSGVWLGWLNWFYPVGDLLAGLAVIATIWITFLAVRYVLRLIRQI